MLASSVLLSVLLAEVGLRAAAVWRDRDWKEFRVALEEAPEPEPGREAALGSLIRRVENPRLVYRLRPSLDTLFKNVSVRTNSQGHPDKAYPNRGAEGVVRILGIGDSVMFGWGVPTEANYLSLLEQRLAVDRPERRWEVLNTGVPGYNTVMEVELLMSAAEEFPPDLVLLGFNANDLVLPVFLHRRPRHWRLERFYLLEALRPGSVAPRLPRVAPSEVAPPYAPLVGDAAFQAAVERLHRWSEAYRTPVIALTLSDLEPMVAAAFKRAGFPVVDLWRQCRAHAEPSELRQQGDGHPSLLAHRLMAATLYDQLEALGVLDRPEESGGAGSSAEHRRAGGSQR